MISLPHRIFLNTARRISNRSRPISRAREQTYLRVSRNVQFPFEFIEGDIERIRLDSEEAIAGEKRLGGLRPNKDVSSMSDTI